MSEATVTTIEGVHQIRFLASNGYLLLSSYDDVTTGTEVALYSAVLDSKGCLVNSEECVAFESDGEVRKDLICCTL